MLEFDTFAYSVLATILCCSCHSVFCLQSNEIDGNKISLQPSFYTNSPPLPSWIKRRIKRDIQRDFRDTIIKSSDGVDGICGTSPLNDIHPDNVPFTKIVGGVETAPHDFPWQVFLVLQKTSGEHFACGGSLINDRWILTAAHCLENIDLIYITLGAHDVNDEKEVHQERYKSRDYVIHPEWDAETLHADIALIQLPFNISFSRYILPVCLDGSSDPSVNYVNETVILTGWGLSGDGGAMSSVLRKATVEVITNEECTQQYDSIVTDEMMCTSAVDHQGSCYGDSGGPMNFRQPDGSWKQIGIVSFGSNQGCESGYANGFTRVSSFATWIQKTTQLGATSGSTGTLASQRLSVVVLLLLMNSIVNQ